MNIKRYIFISILFLLIGFTSSAQETEIDKRYNSIANVITLDDSGCYEIKWYSHYTDKHYDLYVSGNSKNWIHVSKIDVMDRKLEYTFKDCNSLTSPYIYYKLVRCSYKNKRNKSNELLSVPFRIYNGLYQ